MRETFALLWPFEKKEKAMTRNYYDEILGNSHGPHMLSGQKLMQNTAFEVRKNDLLTMTI